MIRALPTIMAALWLVHPGVLAREGVVETDQERIQGDWKLTETSGEGKQVPVDQLGDAKLRFRADKISSNGVGGPFEEVMNFTLNTEQEPRAIDLTMLKGPERGQTAKGIYAFDGDALRICFSKPDHDRPKAFPKVGGPNQALYILTRSKP